MEGEVRERWKELCELATTEQDPEKLIELMREINRLLEIKRSRASSRDDSGLEEARIRKAG
jgi:hypothetical protein